MRRRQLLLSLPSLLPISALAQVPLTKGAGPLQLGACWRGPQDTDPHEAGVLVAEEDAKLMRVAYRFKLPGRAHGLSPEANGGLTIVAARPGSWLLRCDGTGRITQQHDLLAHQENTRLNGHAIDARNGAVIFTTETDTRSGRGRIGVRDRHTFRKLDEWDSRGLEPHQLLLDHEGHLIVANGGIPRKPDDRKYDLHRMESSLTRLDARNGQVLGHWTLPDRRLSMRHLAWSDEPDATPRLLGVAMEATHDTLEERAVTPVFAVFDGERLTLPAEQNDQYGLTGDITAACGGGFVLSSYLTNKVFLWHPSAPKLFRPVAEFRRAYALASWAQKNDLSGALVSTAQGLLRWHPSMAARFWAWPEPMALDNHWVTMPTQA